MNSSFTNNPIFLILLIVVILMVISWIIPNISGDRYENHDKEEWTGQWHMMGMGGFRMFPFFPIIVMVVILYLVFGRDHGRWSSPDVGDSAIEILKKRYAKGEITKKEFEEMKRNLLS